MARDFVGHASRLALLTLLSRVLGMVRDAALALAFGTGQVMDAFGVAFAIPNLFRRLFSEGALSVAFIPVYTGLVERGDEPAARRLANLTVTLLVATLAAIVLVGEGILLVVSATAETTPRLELTLGLTAVMLPFVLTICLVGLLQAILNVRDHFVAPALAPIVLNVLIIAAALVAAPLWGDDLHRRIYGVAGSVLVAGVVQVLVQWPALRRRGLRFRAAWDLGNPGLRHVATLMAPMLVGLGIVQLNVLMDRVIALGLSAHEAADGQMVTSFELWGRRIAYPMEAGAVSVMYYAGRLYQLPLGVFAIALGTAIFPALSRHAHHGRTAELAATLNRGLRVATFIVLPCTAGMILVAEPLVRAIFERGRFEAAGTERVALLVQVYVAGLAAYASLHLLTRACFALQEVRLPVKVSAVAAGANFVLNLVLVWPLGVRGLAAATVLTAAGQAIVLAILLRRRLGPLGLRRYLGGAGRSLLATGVMAAATWAAMEGVARGWPELTGTAGAVARLAAAVPAGAMVYALAAWALGMDELRDVLRRRVG